MLINSVKAALAASVVALLLAPTGCGEPSAIAQQWVTGVELTTLDGESQPLLQPPARARIINFWATWCAPCREEMPDLQRLADRVGPQQIEVVGVTVDRDLNLAREFMLKYGIRFRQLSDPAMTFASQVDVKAYPETFLVDADGRVLRRVVGTRPWADPAFIDQFLAPLVNSRGDDHAVGR